MKQSAILRALLAPVIFMAGCDNITGLDNREPPTSRLTGRVVYQGQAVGLRNNGVELELWEPEYIERYGENQKIPINIAQDGTFSAMVFDGTYKLNLLRNNGPWVNSSDTTIVIVNGSATVDVPVTPYYTIIDPTYSRGAPTTEVPGGSVTATFRVAKVDTSRPLEYVGLYVGRTSFVDRNNSENVPGRERSRSAIQPQLDTDGNITITVNLPANIFESNSPWVREMVFVRVGVKTQGVGEMLFSPVVELAL